MALAVAHLASMVGYSSALRHTLGSPLHAISAHRLQLAVARLLCATSLLRQLDFNRWHAVGSANSLRGHASARTRVLAGSGAHQAGADGHVRLSRVGIAVGDG